MDILLHYILPFVGILVALVVVHELGHFFTAKWFGIKVLEAGLGYPPRAFGFTWKGTIYSVNWLPLGGFVRLLGEEDPSDPQSLAAAAPWKRLIVLASGALINLALPIALFAVMYMLPREVAAGPAVITNVMPDSPAEQAGLLEDDLVRAIDGEEVKNSGDLAREIRLRQGQTIDFKVERQVQFEEEQVLTIPVKSRWDPEDTVVVVGPEDSARSIAADIGISEEAVLDEAGLEYALEEGQILTLQTDTGTETYTVKDTDTVDTIAIRFHITTLEVREAAGLPDPTDPAALEDGQELHFAQGPTGIGIGNASTLTVTEQYPLWEAIPLGMEATWDSLILARNQVIALFYGGQGPSVAGPVGIAQTTGQVVEEAGWQPLLELAALLSINLGIINLLPFPMLDGGRITFVLIEIARGGKRIAPEKEAIVHLVGLALILTMAVVVTYLDVARLISGGSLFE